MAAAVDTFSPSAVLGFGQPPDKDGMIVSGAIYNSLPNFTSQPELQRQYPEHVKAMLEIIARYNLGAYFGVHAAHRHDHIPTETVRLETEMGTDGSTWTKSVAIQNLDGVEMHGMLYKLVHDTFIPFEYATGPSPVAGVDIPTEFLTEVAAYLAKNDLGNVIAVEVADFVKRAEPVAELEIQWGESEPFTVVVATSLIARSRAELIPTGWNHGAGPEDPEHGTHYVKVIQPKNTHKVYVDSTEPVSDTLLRKKLAELGIFRT